MRTTRILIVTVILAVAVMAGSIRAQQRGGSAPLKPPTVLFMCPHGAAKSVLASAYFEQLAKERGLNIRVESAGTDPDPTVAPAVAAHLKRQGYLAPNSNPRKVTAKDFESADVVISIGCDLSGLKEPRGKLVRWDEVPPLSEDLARADEAIRKRVTELIESWCGLHRKEVTARPRPSSRRFAWSPVRGRGRPAAFATSAVDTLSCGTRPVCPFTLSK